VESTLGLLFAFRKIRAAFELGDEAPRPATDAAAAPRSDSTDPSGPAD
jgi:hypothetical protein